MSKPTPDLNQRLIRFGISEPWDFTSSGQSGPWDGVLFASTLHDGFIRSNSDLSYKNTVFRCLVARPRYEGESFSKLLEKGSLIVNYVPVFGDPSPVEGFEAARQWRGWGMIGGIELVDS